MAADPPDSPVSSADALPKVHKPPPPHKAAGLDVREPMLVSPMGLDGGEELEQKSGENPYAWDMRLAIGLVLLVILVNISLTFLFSRGDDSDSEAEAVPASSPVVEEQTLPLPAPQTPSLPHTVLSSAPEDMAPAAGTSAPSAPPVAAVRKTMPRAETYLSGEDKQRLLRQLQNPSGRPQEGVPPEQPAKAPDPFDKQEILSIITRQPAKTYP